MGVILPVIAVVLGLVGLHAPYLSTVFPRLGPVAIYRPRPFHVTFGLSSVLLALEGSKLFPSVHSTIALIVCIVMAAVGLFFRLDWILVDLTDPPSVSVADAAIPTGDTVVGVVRNGEARVWPLHSMLLPRHIVNDRIGGKPVLVSYCAACASAIVWSALVKGRRLTFLSAGVWRRNLILKDRKTGTLWQQGTGEAVMGPLKGSHLELIGSDLVRWDSWSREYPGTLVAADPPAGRRGLIPRAVLSLLLEKAPRSEWINRMFNRSIHSREDSRLGPYEEVIGVEFAGLSKAWPVSMITRNAAVTSLIGAIPVIVRQLDSSGGFRVTVVRDGAEYPVDYVRKWWRGWSELHPDTELELTPLTSAARPS